MVIVGTLCSLLATLLLSYGLTQNVLGIRVVRLLVLFTMLFSGGMIPTYLIVRETGLLNNLWSLILPGLVSPFNTFLLVNALKSLPPSLSESAELDGAGTLRILFRIILPLSLPTMATLLLFYAVAYWNKYFSAILYVPKRENWVLQVLLRQILINDDQGSVGGGTTDTLVAQMGVTLKMATVVTAVIPIMLVYPFVQKYFIKGVMVGAVKE
ncbi:MAG TPA: carbohydrate ABC transporter permease [Candidatus Caccousia avistercoris]|nr:carbohydrate ABC transporter permease [Candidatus Caccousia avistercoris]